jgi:lysophospholipid acyltransferase (LPLAT)-like uncharacterized protein
LYGYLRLTLATSDVDDPGPPAHPAVFALWHRDLPLMITLLGARHPWFLLSPAPNLRPIRVLMTWLGHRSVLGASGDGGRKGIDELLRQRGPDDDAWLAVDGPAGPGFRAKPGIVWLARATGLPIVPISYAAQRDFPLRRRWDQMRFHLPGDRFRVVYGEPIDVDVDADDAVLARVEASLNQLREPPTINGTGSP